MDEQKKGIILNIIINELIEQAKNPKRDNPQQKSAINISDIIYIIYGGACQFVFHLNIPFP